MNTKYLVLASILGGLTLFTWGFIWHAANPLYSKALQEFPDSQTANQTIKTLCPDNGMYLTPEGAIVVTNFNSDMSNKEENMGSALIIEVATNLIFALLLAIIVGRVGILGSVVKGALFLGFVGLAAQVGTEISYWNWYGFPGLFTSLNFIGETLAWFFTGLVICGFYAKYHGPGC